MKKIGVGWSLEIKLRLRLGYKKNTYLSNFFNLLYGQFWWVSDAGQERSKVVHLFLLPYPLLLQHLGLLLLAVRTGILVASYIIDRDGERYVQLLFQSAV